MMYMNPHSRAMHARVPLGIVETDLNNNICNIVCTCVYRVPAWIVFLGREASVLQYMSAVQDMPIVLYIILCKWYPGCL